MPSGRVAGSCKAEPITDVKVHYGTSAVPSRGRQRLFNEAAFGLVLHVVDKVFHARAEVFDRPRGRRNGRRDVGAGGFRFGFGAEILISRVLILENHQASDEV